MKDEPTVIVIAGPTGAGKSTISERLLPGALGVLHFVNADTIARGLSAFRSEEMAIKAGKIMLEHVHELAAQRRNFAFEPRWPPSRSPPGSRNFGARDSGFISTMSGFPRPKSALRECANV